MVIPRSNGGDTICGSAKKAFMHVSVKDTYTNGRHMLTQSNDNLNNEFTSV
jgi:hypothetical protein